MKFFRSVAALMAMLAPLAQGEELRMPGTSTVTMVKGQDPRIQAIDAAKRDATGNLVAKLCGPASVRDPDVKAAVDRLATQIELGNFQSPTLSRPTEATLNVQVTLVIDDKEMRQKISDIGIRCAADRAQAYPILVVMQEVVLNPDGSPLTTSAEMANVNTASSRDLVVEAAPGNAASPAPAPGGGAASSNAPDENFVYTALLKEGKDYRLELTDNAVFRSRHPLPPHLDSLDAFIKSPDFAKDLQLAHDEVQVDYFMVGTSKINAGGTDPNTGQKQCTGTAQVRAFSTDEGRVLAAGVDTESASGNDPEQCRVNVARKLARYVGGQVGPQVQGDALNKDGKGREFYLRFISALNKPLTEGLKDKIGDALEQTPNVVGEFKVVKSTRDAQEVTLFYKGTDPWRELRKALRPSFPDASHKAEGKRVTICVDGECP